MEMKKKIVMALVAFLMVTTSQAQWRVGITGGADYNVFNMDQQYMTDYKVDGRWGITLGVTGQYNVTDWLGVRADLNWTQKNYRHSRVVYSDVDYKLTNNYLQLPVMASFSFGGERLRGFCNLGVYGAYWLNSHRKGSDWNSFVCVASATWVSMAPTGSTAIAKVLTGTLSLIGPSRSTKRWSSTTSATSAGTAVS